MDQKDIVAEIRVLPEIDVDFEINRRVEFISRCLMNSGLQHLVLGISGGIDSSTCGRLAQLAANQLGDGFKFVAVRLPYAVQADEADAQLALQFNQPDLS